MGFQAIKRQLSATAIMSRVKTLTSFIVRKKYYVIAGEFRRQFSMVFQGRH